MMRFDWYQGTFYDDLAPAVLLDRIAAAAADTDHLYDCFRGLCIDQFYHEYSFSLGC